MATGSLSTSAINYSSQNRSAHSMSTEPYNTTEPDWTMTSSYSSIMESLDLLVAVPFKEMCGSGDMASSSLLLLSFNYSLIIL